MNQILLTDNDNNKKKNNSKNYNRTNSNDIKKIITFFAVVIMVFGIAIGGIYGYKIYKNSNGEEKTLATPKLSLEESEEEVTILAEAEGGISKIIYQWNNEEEIVKELNGRTKQNEKLDIPTGENTLIVKVIDQFEQEIETRKEFIREEINSDKIEISLSIIEDGNEKGKIKVVATSELPIKNIAYKWNEDEENITELEENKTSLEIKLDVKRGRNTLYIAVKDSEGNINRIEKTFDGRLKPEFEVYREENRLYMKMMHDMGFKKVEFTINGTTYTYDENTTGYDPEQSELEYYFTLEEGENLVSITADSNEETSNVYNGKCTL